MAFIVVAPGVRDPVKLDTLFKHKVVNETQEISKTRPVSKNHEPGSEAIPDLRQARQHYEDVANDYFQRQPAITAGQIMSQPVVSLTPATSLLDAWRLFRQRRFRHIPIVIDKDMLHGLVSDRDVLRYGFDHPGTLATTALSVLMQPRILTATADSEIREVVRVMFTQRIGSIPIVDPEGHLRGIITRSDILRVVMQNAPLELWI
jgi:CBS domain-containing protein